MIGPIAIPRSPRWPPNCGPGRSPWTARLRSPGSMASLCSRRSTAGARRPMRSSMRSTAGAQRQRPAGAAARRAQGEAGAAAGRLKLPASCTTSTPMRMASWYSSTLADSGWRASCRSGSARPIGQGHRGTGSRSRTRIARQCSARVRGGGNGGGIGYPRWRCRGLFSQHRRENGDFVAPVIIHHPTALVALSFQAAPHADGVPVG
jgi:hypothetical protein